MCYEISINGWKCIQSIPFSSLIDIATERARERDVFARAPPRYRLAVHTDSPLTTIIRSVSPMAPPAYALSAHRCADSPLRGSPPDRTLARRSAAITALRRGTARVAHRPFVDVPAERSAPVARRVRGVGSHGPCGLTLSGQRAKPPYLRARCTTKSRRASPRPTIEGHHDRQHPSPHRW